MAALIVYGSTYPWRFGSAHPDSWQSRFYLADFLVNIAVYIPVGLFARFAIGGRFWLPFGVCCALSLGVELLQSLMPARVSSVYDVISNTVGAAIGIAAAAVMKRRLRLTMHRAGVDGSALLLLFCGLLYVVFAMRDHLPVSAATVVFCAGVLGEGIKANRPWLWLLAAVAVVLVRFPVEGVVFGAAAGAGFYAVVRNCRWPAVPALVLLGVLVYRGVFPFRLTPEAASFSMVPFEAMLASPWQSGVRVLVEKVFYYGAAAWVLRRSGQSILAAGLTVSVVLACIEFAQRWIPGRSAEITDPVLVLLVAVALDAFRD